MSLKDTWTRWAKNQAVIGFTAKLVTDGKLYVNVSNSPKKYLKAIRALSDELLKEGIQEIGKAFQFQIASQDSEQMGEEVRGIILKHTDFLLDILIKEGYDAFHEALSCDAAILSLRYELNKLTLDEQSRWRRWDGSLLTESKATVIMEACGSLADRKAESDHPLRAHG